VCDSSGLNCNNVLTGISVIYYSATSKVDIKYSTSAKFSEKVVLRCAFGSSSVDSSVMDANVYSECPSSHPYDATRSNIKGKVCFKESTDSGGSISMVAD
jgi:hypothetical protein